MPRTLVVSDLHLGARTDIDLLRRPELREPLLEALEGIDRLVVLGDALELRHGPAREALAAARAPFEALGERLEGRELVLVPGNHDHQLIGAWLERRGREPTPEPLGLELLLEPREASPLAEALAGWAAPASVRVAYPGLWLRDDVWATHGHYLDRHTTVPAYERIGAAVVERLVRPLPDPLATPEDYEAILAPMYALLYGAAQYLPESSGAAHSGASLRLWEELTGGGRGRRRLRYRLLAAGLPVTIAALNRAGLGPLRPELSGPALRRASLEAMGEVVGRLGATAAHVVFGHTHRSGPWPRDAAQDWRVPAGARLLNTGSWVYEPAFLTPTPDDSPYWPGTCVELGEAGPPQVRRLLGDRGHAELRGAPG